MVTVMLMVMMMAIWVYFVNKMTLAIPTLNIYNGNQQSRFTNDLAGTNTHNTVLQNKVGDFHWTGTQVLNNPKL